MKTIFNPHTEDVSVVYGPAGHGQKYTIKSGESVLFTDANEPVANFFIETYGFLKVTSEEVLVDNNDPLKCQYCGFPAKSVFGKRSHERFCKGKTEKVIIEIAPDKTIRPLNRVSSEIANFQNTDGVGIGTETEEMVGNRKQKIVYDRDGVGWYGPGLESDITPLKRKPGQF